MQRNQTCNFHNHLKEHATLLALTALNMELRYWWWKRLIQLNVVFLLNEHPVNVMKLRGPHFCLCQGHWRDLSCENRLALKEFSMILVFKQVYFGFKAWSHQKCLGYIKRNLSKVSVWPDRKEKNLFYKCSCHQKWRTKAFHLTPVANLSNSFKASWIASALSVFARVSKLRRFEFD